MVIQCNDCSEKRERLNKSKWGIFTGLLLAILPKCPFCMVAYTSTAMLCGEGVVLERTITNHSVLTLLFSATLCLTTFLAILLNRRGRRTLYALALALLGSGMIMVSVLSWGGLPLYYAGTLIVFTGVWMNGSFYWVWRQAKAQFPFLAGKRVV